MTYPTHARRKDGVSSALEAHHRRGPPFGEPLTEKLSSRHAIVADVNRQNASAYHKPFYSKGLKLADANLADVRLGRPLSFDEAKRINQGIADQTSSDFFSPIRTPNGYRSINVPEYRGIDNAAFQDHVANLVNSDIHPDAHMVAGRSAGNYIKNDWQESPNGEAFVSQISGTGRPDVQRRAYELLSTLGPKISEI
jgi:hypothetical protein